MSLAGLAGLIALGLAFAAGLALGLLARSGTSLLRTRGDELGPYQRLVRSALARVAADDPEAAADTLGQACRVESDDDSAYLLLAEQLRRAGEYPQARRAVDIVLSRREQDHEIASAAWLIRGRLLEQSEDAEGALAAYATAAELDRRATGPLVLRGQLLSRLRRWKEAIECGEQLARLQPERGRRVVTRRRLLLARELLAEGRADKALGLANKAVKEGSEPAAAGLTCGDALFQLRRVGEAVRHWVESSRHAPWLSALVLDRLEHVSSSAERRERAWSFALDAVERMDDGDPSVWRVVAWLSDSALRRGELEEARTWCRRLERLAPGSATASRLRVRCDAASGGGVAGNPHLDGTVRRWSSERVWQEPWSCRRCGFRMEEFDWRCPSCHAWGSAS